MIAESSAFVNPTLARIHGFEISGSIDGKNFPGIHCTPILAEVGKYFKQVP